MNLPPALTKKLGPFPVWAWGVAITGGIVLGLYLRHRGAAAKQQQATADPNAGLDALQGYSGFGVADPNAGMDSTGLISGLMQQNEDLLSLLLAGVGGGGSPPATSPSSAPAASPPAAVAVSSFGASPSAAPTTVDATPDPPPADPAYPGSTYISDGRLVDTGTQTSTGLPIQETAAVAQGADVMSAASSSTGGVGGTGYLLMSDKTLRPSPGVNVMM